MNADKHVTLWYVNPVDVFYLFPMVFFRFFDYGVDVVLFLEYFNNCRIDLSFNMHADWNKQFE